MTKTEQLIYLAHALLVVAATGALPEGCRDDAADLLDVNSKPRHVVPIYCRFDGLTYMKGRGANARLEYISAFNPDRFMSEQFSLGRLWGFVLTGFDVMPSTIQIATALELADGDRQRAQVILDSRATVGIRKAEEKVGKAYPCSYGWIIRALWRFPGNADVLWYALRDEAQRCSDELKAVANG